MTLLVDKMLRSVTKCKRKRLTKERNNKLRKTILSLIVIYDCSLRCLFLG